MSTAFAPDTITSESDFQTPGGDPFPACKLSQLEPNLGSAVLLPDGRQFALFRHLSGGEGQPTIYAVSNIDPYTGASVMSRGIVGDHDGSPTVASPLLKQAFRLDTGEALDGSDNRLETAAIRIHDGVVYLFAGSATEICS